MTDLSRFVDEVSINLYTAAANQSGNGNLLLSPISIAYATLLVYLGSRGQTKANFDAVYKFNPQKPADSNILMFADALSSFSAANGSAPKPQINRFEEPKIELNLANSVFVRNGFKLEPTYKAAVTNFLKAAIESKDFQGNAEGSRNDINGWVESKTGGKIKDLLPQGSIDASTVAILVNAVYFKASWEDDFQEALTKKEPFKTLNGAQKTVDMMHREDKYKYFDDAELGVQYLEIQYASREASFLVILPKAEGGLRDVERKLNKDVFSRLASQAQPNTLTELSLPKFKVESSFSAKALLQAIGITDVFSNSADLSGMAPGGGMKVSDAYHKTFIGELSRRSGSNQLKKTTRLADSVYFINC